MLPNPQFPVSVKEYIAMGVHFRSLQEAILSNSFF